MIEKRNFKFNLSYTRVLIIAVVFGVIAKMIGPESTEAGIRRNTARLVDALVTMRTSIELYRAQHLGQLPSVSSFEDFERALTRKIGKFGPYIDQIPVNPFNGLDTVRFDGAPAGTNQAGWRLDTKTGYLQADNDPAYAEL